MSSSSLLDCCSDDIIRRVANDWLSPQEVSYLASSHSVLRKLLPYIRPLQIRIVATHNEIALEQKLFVRECSSGRVLEYTDSLQYGQDYVFWQYDKERGTVVELMQHLPFALDDNDDDNGYDVAFCPRQQSHTSKTWTIAGPKGHPIPWKSPVNVVANNAQEEQKTYLSAVPIIDEVKNSYYIRWRTSTAVGPDEEVVIVNTYSQQQQDWNNENDTDWIWSTLNIRAVPVFTYGKEWSIYSQQSFKNDAASYLDFQRCQVNVEFELWTHQGFLYLYAPTCLPFALVLPMNDDEDDAYIPLPLQQHHATLETLYNVNQSYIHELELYFQMAGEAHPDVQAQENDVEKDDLIIDDDADKLFSPLTEAEKDNGYQQPQRYIVKSKNNNKTIQQWKKPEFANLPRDPSRCFVAVFAPPLE